MCILVFLLSLQASAGIYPVRSKHSWHSHLLVAVFGLNDFVQSVKNVCLWPVLRFNVLMYKYRYMWASQKKNVCLKHRVNENQSQRYGSQRNILYLE